MYVDSTFHFPSPTSVMAGLSSIYSPKPLTRARAEQPAPSTCRIAGPTAGHPPNAIAAKRMGGSLPALRGAFFGRDSRSATMWRPRPEKARVRWQTHTALPTGRLAPLTDARPRAARRRARQRTRRVTAARRNWSRATPAARSPYWSEATLLAAAHRDRREPLRPGH